MGQKKKKNIIFPHFGAQARILVGQSKKHKAHERSVATLPQREKKEKKPQPWQSNLQDQVGSEGFILFHRGCRVAKPKG